MTTAIFHRAAPAARRVLGVGLLAAFAALWLMLAQPNGYDYYHAFEPAAQLWLRGQSPYLQGAFFNPPWALVPLLPLVLLPGPWVPWLLALANLGAFAAAGVRLGAKPLPLALLILSPQMLRLGFNGQIDWLLPLGLLLPRPAALFFVLAKPQLGIGLAVYWLVDSWRAGGWRQLAKDFGPVGAAFALSFAVYGFYLGGGAVLTGPTITWNISPWPYSLIVGAALLVSALRNRRAGHALTAGPFFSPYLAGHSIVSPVLGLVHDQWVMAAACLSLWAVYVLSP